MENIINEKNTENIYLSEEIVPIIKTHGIYFEEKEVLDFTENDSENFKQFLIDIQPKLIEKNSNTICLPGVINGMPPLVNNIKSKNLIIENNAPIKCLPEDQNLLIIKGYRSGTRSSIVKCNYILKEEYDKLSKEEKEKFWIIAKHKEQYYYPKENGNILIRLKGCGMWNQKNQVKFPGILLRECKCYRDDYDETKKYIEVRGFNSVNASARELYALREIKPYFDKLNILIGNSPLGFWKYINLKNDNCSEIEKCVCIMETIGDKRLETHFLIGVEKMLSKLIKEEKCKELIYLINNEYKKNKIRPPNSNNTTFKRVLNLPLYDISESIFKIRYSFEKSMENYEKEILNKHGFYSSNEILKIIKNYPEIYTISLIYAEIGYEIGRILSTFHRTGNNWGTFFNNDIRLIDSNAHGDNIIILEKHFVKERYLKNNIIQFFSMVDFDQMVRPELSISVWNGKIEKNPKIATEYFWVELESLGNDLGGVASEQQFFLNIPKRIHPYGVYYDLLYILRDIMIYQFFVSYIEPLKEREFIKDINIDEFYNIIEEAMKLTHEFEA